MAYAVFEDVNLHTNITSSDVSDADVTSLIAEATITVNSDINIKVTRERIRQLFKGVGDMEKYNHTYLIDDVYLKNYKKCYRCKKTLELKKFYKNKSGIRKHSNLCIKCQKETLKKYTKKYLKEYRKGGKYYQKTLARNALNFALKKNKLKKGKCVLRSEKCNGQIEAHHYLGYEKEHYYDVRWFCRKHHRIVDGLKPFGRKS
ncbi:hypothetical protein LCGC14_1459310 [marine sediment metagenome]|uniref:Uncharacterized protein n=1 Tax=marine sediment metagenome TaxID=412755 RepID=A0A0F9JG40_9ZZZZ